MLSRTTTAWLFVAVGVAAGAAWMAYRVVPSDGGEPRPRMLLGINVDSLDSLLVEVDGTTLVCQRRQGTWWLVRPIEARADDERIHRLLDTLALAPVNDIITAAEQRRHNVSQRDYGLASPRARILLRGPACAPLELRLGNAPAHGQSLYVGVTGSAFVWVTDPSLIDALPTGIGDLRDRALLPCAADRLRRIELRAPGSPLVAAERDAAGTWWLKQPETRRAAPGAIAALLDFVTGTKIATFVVAETGSASATTTADPYSLGIAYGCHPDGSPLIARFWFANGQPSFEYHELVFGKPCLETPDEVYLLSTEEQLVVTVDATLPAVLRVNPEDLRDHRVWPFANDAVQRLRIRGETDSVTLERAADGGWTITQPIQAAARGDACESLLSSLLRLQDTQVVQAHPPPRQDLIVELSTTAPDGVHTALVSRVETTDGSGETAFDWHLLATHETHRTDALQLPAQFGDPVFFAGFCELDVLRIAPESLGGISQQLGTNGVQRVALIREGEWSVVEPTGAVASAPALLDIVRVVANLRASHVAALAPSSRDGYGLRQPTCTLVFELIGPEPSVRILLIGADDPSGGTYAMVKGQESIFVLAPEVATILLRPVAYPP